MRFEKLSYQESILGDIIDTRLDLQEGQLYGAVDKLNPGSRYEVKMPMGVATVRGTEYFVECKSGNVIVTSGVVSVKVILQTASGPLEKTVSVGAGFTLKIPNEFKNPNAFYALAPVPTPPGLSRNALLQLTKVGKYKKFTNGNLTETFAAQRKRNGQIKVTKPPLSIVASP